MPCIYTFSRAAIESPGYRTRDIVPFQSTFNSRDSNLYRAAVWIMPFREDYVNIYTASEIPADFPTAPTPYIHTYLFRDGSRILTGSC